MNTTTALLKSSSSTRWLARQAQDSFVRAAAGSYRARSAFKLKELAKRYPILGRRVVDLGAAPGGWSQVAAERQRYKGVVVAVDLLPMEEMKGVKIVTGDFFDPAVQGRVLELLRAVKSSPRPVHRFGLRAVEEPGEEEAPTGGVAIEQEAEVSEDTLTPSIDPGLADCVLSDMMAAMSGIRDRDVAASLDLVSAATYLAHQVLRPKDETYAGGSLVLKFFMHPDLLAFRKAELEPYFTRVQTDKPKSSRKESSEAYWVCTGYKGGYSRA